MAVLSEFVGGAVGLTQRFTAGPSLNPLCPLRCHWLLEKTGVPLTVPIEFSMLMSSRAMYQDSIMNVAPGFAAGSSCVSCTCMRCVHELLRLLCGWPVHVASQIEPQRPQMPVAGTISERGPMSPGLSLLPLPYV